MIKDSQKKSYNVFKGVRFDVNAVEILPVNEVLHKIKAGEVHDGKSIVAILYY